MADCRNEMSVGLGQLGPHFRNNYFYGKLMDEFHFEMEQTYFNRKRWLLNRLALGSGVLCGLKVVVSEKDNRNVQILPGVAIDDWGREIIVPALSRPIDPRQLTDECCRPSGEQAQDSVLICLAYHECESEPVPVLVGECETEQDCAPSTICERYCVMVLEDTSDPDRPACPLPETLQFEDGRLAVESYRDLVELVSQPCPTINGQPCVPLAHVKLSGPQQEFTAEMIEPVIRPLVYSNALLFELMLCLWQRVEECCNGTEPSKPQPPVVIKIALINTQGESRSIEKLDSPPALDVSEQFSTIEVIFSKDIYPDSVTTVTPAGNEAPEAVSFLVSDVSEEEPKPVKGTVKPAGKKISFTTAEVSGFEVGSHKVSLRGSTEDGPAIADSDGLVLDGSPNPEDPNALPSGDGEAGGDFEFTFVIGELI